MTNGKDGPKLLSGGNPQIPKGYGNAPVQAWIDAAPGWKHSVGQRIDDLVCREVADVVKAVKWNSPLYGREKDIWFLGLHCFDRYIKVTFFRGTALDPMPPETSKVENIRYFHIHEDDDFEDRLALWVRQAMVLPGERL